MSRPFFLGPAAGLIIGFAHATGIPALMCLSVLIPALAVLQPTRRGAGLAAFTYYFACSWPGAVVSYNLHRTAQAAITGELVCVTASILLAMPFAALWSPIKSVAASRMPIVLTAIIVPPLGVISIGHPLAVAGFLFPGAGWAGVLGMLTLPSLLLLYPRFGAATLAIASFGFHARFDGTPSTAAGWLGVNQTTSCPPIECDLQRLTAVQRRSIEAPEAVLVFPEAAVPTWTAATEIFWRDTDDQLRRNGTTVLIGSTIEDGRLTRNVLLARGSEHGYFEQRVPVPGGMWRPFANGSVPLNPFGSAVFRVRHERLAVLICYEQLIPWTWLSAMRLKPTMAVAISNDEWSKGTSVPAYRRSVVRSWTELFGLPCLVATRE
ncbi:MAG: hypothetical protein JNK87_32175 [Bryobacterales bacterium]|nr:hypothetical protein [Bryobacterales bacterium]